MCQIYTQNTLFVIYLFNISLFQDGNPGPTTTTVIESCTDCKKDKDDNVIISDLTLPAPLKSAVSMLLSSENKSDGLRRLVDPSFEETNEVIFSVFLSFVAPFKAEENLISFLAKLF